MKTVIFTTHALERGRTRGASEDEVRAAIIRGTRERTGRGRWLCRHSLQFNGHWQGKYYAIKQVVPVVAETEGEIIVVTVYTFYF